MSIIVDKNKVKVDELVVVEKKSVYSPNPNQVVCMTATNDKSKVRVPMSYAIEKMGIKPENNGKKDIKMKFKMDLLPRQVPIYPQALDVLKKKNVCFLSLFCGFGKCQKYDTEIIMYDGKIKKIQNIVPGDVLMGDDSKPRNVMSVCKGYGKMYKITNKKGETYGCNDAHILSLKCISSTFRPKQFDKGDVQDISIDDYFNESKSYRASMAGYKVGVTFPEKELPFDPYMLGYWLGDGDTAKAVITTADPEVLEYFGNNMPQYGLNIKKMGKNIHYRFTNINNPDDIPHLNKNHYFTNFLKEYKLKGNKHIPHLYKCNSRSNQLKLLAGIIDSDGYYKKCCYEIAQKSDKLAHDIVYLCRSLGFGCMIKKRKKTCTNGKNGPVTGEYNIISVFGNGVEEIPVLLERKKGEKRVINKNALVSSITVEEDGYDDYYGFTLDGNGRYLLGDFTVTHNTAMSLKMARFG